MNDYKKISISIPLSGKLLENVDLLLNDLNQKYKVNFIKKKNCRPHINLFSGLTNKFDLIKKLIKKNSKLKKNRKIFINGYGMFLNNKPTIYLRFKHNNNLIKIRNIILKKTKYWSKIDHTSLGNAWFPKSTIVHQDLDINLMSNVCKFILKKNVSKSMQIKELVFLDFTKSEKEIENFEI